MPVDTRNIDIISKYFDVVQEEIKKLISEDKEIKPGQVELFNQEIFNQPDEIQDQIRQYVDKATMNNLDIPKVAKIIYDKFKLQVKNNVFNQDDVNNVPNPMVGERKYIKSFEGFFSKEKWNGDITELDLSKSKFYHMMKSFYSSPYYNELVTKTLDTVNMVPGLNDRKHIDKEYVDNIVLFIARILRNYDNMPTEKEFQTEYEHFLK